MKSPPRAVQIEDGNEWNGIVVLNEVRNGSYDIMPLSASYLARKYS